MRHSQSPNKIDALRVAFVSAGWHKEIVTQAKLSFHRRMLRAGLIKSQIDYFEVPGSKELPLAAKWLAETKQYDAVALCGLIVDGGIYRHEFVAMAVIEHIVRVELSMNLPVISIVLTPKHFDETDKESVLALMDHMSRFKGKEGAEAVLGMLAFRDSLAIPSPKRKASKSRKKA